MGFRCVLEVITLALAGTTLQFHAGAQESLKSANHPPVVDYTTSQRDESEIGRIRSARYDHGDVKEETGDATPLPTISHWWQHLAALPVDAHAIVITGIAGTRQAHLSHDATGVYTVYSIRVEHDWKDTNRALVGTTLTAERVGGTVRFASGKEQTYSEMAAGQLLVGHRYVLFLRPHEAVGDFSLITAYEILSDKVFAVDGQNAPAPTRRLQFDDFDGVAFSKFSSDLKKAIATTN